MGTGMRQALLALAGDKKTVAALPPDSPLARHLPAAQAAIEAFCAGDDEAMRAALRQIPFRSPYRDLRWLLEALTAYPRDREAGLARLAKIAPDSPFRCPAQAAAALLRGEQPKGKAAREFVAAFHAPPEDARALFRQWLKQAREQPDDHLREALKALLVHYPQGLNAYEKVFGRLDEVERLRLRALHEEHHGDPLQAYGHWVDLAMAYQKQGENLKAAAVARHLAELAREFGGPADSEVENNLQNARILDPDDRANWLDLAEYYRLVDDQKARRQVIDAALKRFPDDPKVIAAAAATAFDRQTYQKAARLYRRLLALDPLDQNAQGMLLASLLGQARKQLGDGRPDLARKTLQEALRQAPDAERQGRIWAFQGIVELIDGDPVAAAHASDQVRTRLPPPLDEWVITATVMLIDHPSIDSKPFLKTLRQVMEHAALQPLEKTRVLTLLRDAAGLAGEDWDAAQALLRAGQRYFKRALTLDWSLEELRVLGELLLQLECWQWLRDLVRGHPLWKQRHPLLIWLDAEAKCRGVPENLGPHDMRRLFTALDQAAKSGDHWLAQRIDALVSAHSPVDLEAAEAELVRVAQEQGMTPQEVLQTVVDIFNGVFDFDRKKQ